MASTRKLFLLNDDELERLRHLQEALFLPSEADVVRYGMAALERILNDGIAEDARVTLTSRGEVMTLRRRDDEAFELESRSVDLGAR